MTIDTKEIITAMVENNDLSSLYKYANKLVDDIDAQKQLIKMQQERMAAQDRLILQMDLALKEALRGGE